MKNILVQASEDLGIPLADLERVLARELQRRAEQLVDQANRFADLAAIEGSLPSSVHVPRLAEKIAETLALLVNLMTKGKTLEGLLQSFDRNAAYKHEGYRFQYAMTQVIVDQAKTLVDIETVIKALIPYTTGVLEAKQKRERLQLAQSEEEFDNFISQSPSPAEISKRIREIDETLGHVSHEHTTPLRVKIYEAWLNACTTRADIETSPPRYRDQVLKDQVRAKCDVLAHKELAGILGQDSSIETCRRLLLTFGRYPQAAAVVKKAWDEEVDKLVSCIDARSSLETLQSTHAMCRLESSQEQRVLTLWNKQALKAARALVTKKPLTLFEVKQALQLCHCKSEAYAMLAKAAAEIWGIRPALGLK